jgi:chromosome partitioning protein
MYLAAGLAEHGRTLLVDCDPQQSAHEWHENTALPFQVVGMPVKTVHKDLSAVAAGYDHIVLDTPPGNIPIMGNSKQIGKTGNRNVGLLPL